MRSVAADVLNGTPYRFEARSIEPHRLDMTFMRNALLIYKEALHNVLKHARAHDVTIDVTHDDRQFVLRVEDDGVGFDETRIRPGHGLENMRRRAQQSGGQLEIARSAAGGTRIMFTAPMAESRDGRGASSGTP
jgi:signal transduction histidine kinase